MIKTLPLLAVAAVLALLSAPRAEASHGNTVTYRSGYSSCGCPIYTTRYVRGYDCYRRPIYGYSQSLRARSSCRHRGYARPTVYRRSNCAPVSRSRVVVRSRPIIRVQTRSHRGRSYNYPSRSRSRCR